MKVFSNSGGLPAWRPVALGLYVLGLWAAGCGDGQAPTGGETAWASQMPPGDGSPGMNMEPTDGPTMRPDPNTPPDDDGPGANMEPTTPGDPAPQAGPDAGGVGSPDAGGAITRDAGNDPGAADEGAPMPSPGCTGGGITAGETEETIQVGSRQREYVQTVPSTYDGSEPFAVLLDFHGGTYDGPRWHARASNKFPEMAETERFIYITPTGLNQWWTTTEGKSGADGMFMQALLDHLKDSACIDTRRVYATGCSMGGDMSFFMACYFSDQIAAALPMCGTSAFDLEGECQPERPISLTFAMGSRDSLNCWEPPRTSVGNPCASEVLDVFKELNGCTGEPEETWGGLCQTHTQCAEGTEASICLVDATHTGIYTASDLDIYTDGWDWLKRFHIR